MKSKLIGSICLVLGIVIIVTTGTSFAYFTATTDSNGNTISGETIKFDVQLTSTTIYKATRLVPLDDDLIEDAITKDTNKCIDSKGYEVCSLYNLTLVNEGDAQILNGYIVTTETTYITDNLKYQLFDEDYNPISDVTTLSRTLDEKIYFQSGSTKIATEVNNASKKEVTYYLAIWLHETKDLQNDDYSKKFSGKIIFESINGNQISAAFSS